MNIKPCPYCSSQEGDEDAPRLTYDDEHHYVMCYMCGARGPRLSNTFNLLNSPDMRLPIPDYVISRWNCVLTKEERELFERA